MLEASPPPPSPPSDVLVLMDGIATVAVGGPAAAGGGIVDGVMDGDVSLLPASSLSVLLVACANNPRQQACTSAVVDAKKVSQYVSLVTTQESICHSSHVMAPATAVVVVGGVAFAPITTTPSTPTVTLRRDCVTLPPGLARHKSQPRDTFTVEEEDGGGDDGGNGKSLEQQ